MKNKFLIIATLLFSSATVFCQQSIYKESFDNGSVQGVKGKAKLFDGFFTENMVAANAVPSSGSFTITAWIAPQEYASTVAAIADKESDFKKGFLFGINQTGNLSASVAVNGEWVTCVSTKAVPLLQWTHVSMVVENAKAINLYLNGENVGSIALTANTTLCDTCLLSIGKTQTKTTAANTERATSAFIKTNNRFDGLIDELFIFPNALTSNEVATNFTNIIPSIKQPLQFRQMPSGKTGPAKFGAVYTRLKYSPGWDSLWRGSDQPDIVVRFDNSPVKFVFWRGTGYIPAIVNEKNMWATDQSLEHYGTGECYEAMGDKQARFTHVRLIENTPARVVVHWRYALAGIKHQLLPEDENGWSDWTDEYWTIYPDGIAARKQVLWSKRYEKDKAVMQWQETIFFCQPGTRPQDNVDLNAITFMDMERNKESYSWVNGPPKLKVFDKPLYQPIEMVNFKAVYKPFNIFNEKRICEPFSFGFKKEYTTFPNWNHWPVQQVMSDGRNAVAFDKPSHASLTDSDGKTQIVEKKGEGEYWVCMLKGMTNQPIDSLLALAQSWNFAASINNISGGANATYNKYERAYLVTLSNPSQQSVAFTVNGSNTSPIENLPIVLNNFSATVKSIRINNKLLKAGKDYTVGKIDEMESSKTILFIKLRSNSNTIVRIN
jgi:Concanavalin A-like lectin/glucanases superfamily